MFSVNMYFLGRDLRNRVLFSNFDIKITILNFRMHRFTKIVLFSLAIVSIIEVFSDPQTKVKSDHSEDEHDFREFDDPADKYSEAAQEEQLEIRAPSGEGNVPGKTFVPPMNMPPIKFSYCVSCGYRNAYVFLAKTLIFCNLALNNTHKSSTKNIQPF